MSDKAESRIRVREERPGDVAGVRAVNLAAFDTAVEADLVEALRVQCGDSAISLVAVDDEAIVGHILFSPMTALSSPGAPLMGLAPMAVVPARQREGIGSALVREGLAACRQRAIQAVFVLGHAAYYPRFDFVPASRFGIACEYEVPDDVFMALELVPGALGASSGTVRYHEAFAGL
jgi:putative acetyltransferase